MRQSPRRPLILKRRKLPFPKNEPERPHNGAQCKTAPAAPGDQGLPDTLRFVDHPSMPDTQVVVIPKTADLQTVIDTLSAQGKECGPKGPHKFILLSGGSGASGDWPSSLCWSSPGEEGAGRASGIPPTLNPKPVSGDGEACPADPKPLATATPRNRDRDCSPLNDSLTNIQWLGGMCSDGLGSDAGRRASNKENQEPCAQRLQLSQHLDGAQRPPYSYMAMIQFAVNSKPDRRMTLKEIYTWIEDHFPYFRDVAKPGWKNSIRHNLSLHDMFTRETSPDGKISFWTIRPEANRCLTLDQVYKPTVDPCTPPPTQVCEQQQLKPAVPQIKKATASFSSERKMKPLLPRADSYLVPIQLSLNPSIFLPSPQLPLAAPQQNCISFAADFQGGGGKRVRIAPKCAPPPVEEFKGAPLGVSLPRVAPAAPPCHALGGSSASRRKQRLAPPSREEPVLLFPDSTFFDSGLTSDLTSDLSASRDTGLESPGRAYAFKTPVKGSRPVSSTPSKPPVSLTTTPSPGGAQGHGALDFSPIRSPLGLPLTPQHPNAAPCREQALFSSPRELLTCPARPSPGSGEPQAGGAAVLAEGLVLDTINDSLSKILVDISFSGLEDEELDVCNISWSHLIPELK
ncbi:forkhead box protein M1-like isoform X1 [Conger conger]|uniref:forkhead box protein M1-like isoform X1 n=1 Tax=Conger conger TaxID=82655 RepID=UPI002A5A4A72|nr:forkhead box protein M1-like isoform X1 [Conger conger]XP_061085045.1 forkhead box protein M1-like isoform X1 [Conger conger]